MAGDASCEVIHNEKKMQKAKFYSLSKGGKGLKCAEIHQHQKVGTMSLYWIIQRGVLLCGHWPFKDVATQEFSVGFT